VRSRARVQVRAPRVRASVGRGARARLARERVELVEARAERVVLKRAARVLLRSASVRSQRAGNEQTSMMPWRSERRPSKSAPASAGSRSHRLGKQSAKSAYVHVRATRWTASRSAAWKCCQRLLPGSLSHAGAGAGGPAPSEDRRGARLRRWKEDAGASPSMAVVVVQVRAVKSDSASSQRTSHPGPGSSDFIVTVDEEDAMSATAAQWPALYNPSSELHDIQHGSPIQPKGKYLAHPHGPSAHLLGTARNP
jgi:hypothetical protein